MKVLFNGQTRDKSTRVRLVVISLSKINQKKKKDFTKQPIFDQKTNQKVRRCVKVTIERKKRILQCKSCFKTKPRKKCSEKIDC